MVGFCFFFCEGLYELLIVYQTEIADLSYFFEFGS